MTSLELTKVRLSPRYYDHIRTELATNKRNGRLLGNLLADLQLEKGSLWAIVPSSRADEAKDDPEAGIFTKEQRQAAAADLATALMPSLQEEGGIERILMFEWADRSEDLYPPGPAQAFLSNSSRFDFATRATPREAVAQLLRSSLWFPTVGVLTGTPGGMEVEDKSKVDPDVLEEFVRRLDLLLVGAWDADGYVCWEPPGA